MSFAWTYTLLAMAILAEVIATSALKASDGFTRPTDGADADQTINTQGNSIEA